MKRRDLGLLTGAGIVTATVGQTAARAQAAAPDPKLLTTTLTPFGAERAGNADGSIPAWTGGWVTTPTTPTEPIDVPSPYSGDAMLYEVNASNLAQYADLVSVGLQAMITKFGFSLKVYPTHRPAAAPQYVYDNIALNVTRASLDPKGGRFGFVNAYGGIPFPIINTADPLIGGAQLIWNHLTQWGGFSNHTTFSPAMVVINKQVILSGGGASAFLYPYYDPNGTLETYDGYYSKLAGTTLAPAASDGQQAITWHTTNVFKNPDLYWSLVAGQGRVRKDPDESYDTPIGGYDGLANIDESQCFYGNPQQYDWTYITKKEMLLAYNNNHIVGMEATDYILPDGPNTQLTRWEKHRVWVVEANLHPGIKNVLSKRRFYIDEDTGAALLGEAYDGDGNLTRFYMVATRTCPGVPVTIPVHIVTFSLSTGDYVCQGQFDYQNFKYTEWEGPNDPSLFEPQEMAANASF